MCDQPACIPQFTVIGIVNRRGLSRTNYVRVSTRGAVIEWRVLDIFPDARKGLGREVMLAGCVFSGVLAMGLVVC